MANNYIIQILGSYEETSLGLPYSISIRDSVRAKVDEKTKEIISTKVPNFEGLVAAFIMLRIIVANKLLGAEVRFFRKSLGLNGREFAKVMNVKPETVSRWESEDGKGINEKDERLLRIYMGAVNAEKVPHFPFSTLKIMQLGLKSVFEKGYQPDFVFYASKRLVDEDEEWQGNMAA
jgi:DNA-binding transcriptional regulator YiaG